MEFRHLTETKTNQIAILGGLVGSALIVVGPHIPEKRDYSEPPDPVVESMTCGDKVDFELNPATHNFKDFLLLGSMSVEGQDKEDGTALLSTYTEPGALLLSASSMEESDKLRFPAEFTEYRSENTAKIYAANDTEVFGSSSLEVINSDPLMQVNTLAMGHIDGIHIYQEIVCHDGPER